MLPRLVRFLASITHNAVVCPTLHHARLPHPILRSFPNTVLYATSYSCLFLGAASSAFGWCDSLTDGCGVAECFSSGICDWHTLSIFHCKPWGIHTVLTIACRHTVTITVEWAVANVQPHTAKQPAGVSVCAPIHQCHHPPKHNRKSICHPPTARGKFHSSGLCRGLCVGGGAGSGEGCRCSVRSCCVAAARLSRCAHICHPRQPTAGIFTATPG